MGSEMRENRLFVPLSTKPYEWFKSGRKSWELRKYARYFTREHVRVGRMVELRRGYTNRESALWGRISEVIATPSLSEFFERVDWRQVLPDSTDRKDAELTANSILGLDNKSDQPVIGFCICLEGHDATSAQE